MKWSPLWRLRRLTRSGVIYYLTGSMASNYWGIPRTTHDLDFVVQLPAAAANRLIEEFQGDFYLDETAGRAVDHPPHQFNAVGENGFKLAQNVFSA